MHFEDREVSHDEYIQTKWNRKDQASGKYTVRIWYDDHGGIDEDKTYSEHYLRSTGRGRFANSGGSGSSSSSKKSKGGGGSSSSHSAPVEKEEYIPQPLTPAEEEVLNTPTYDMDLDAGQWLQYIVELWNGVAKIRPELDEDIERVINKKKEMIQAVKDMDIPDDDYEFINLAVAFTTIKLTNSVVVFIKKNLDSSIDNGKFNKAIRGKEEEVEKELQNDERWAHNDVLRAQAQMFIAEGNYKHAIVKRYYLDEMEDAATSDDVSKLDVFDEVLEHLPSGAELVDQELKKERWTRHEGLRTRAKQLISAGKYTHPFVKRYSLEEMEDAAKSGDVSRLDIFDVVFTYHPTMLKEADKFFRLVEVPTEEQKLEKFANRMFEFVKRYCLVIISSEGNNIIQKSQSLLKSTQNMGASSMMEINKSQSRITASLAGSMQKATQKMTPKLGQFSSLGGFNRVSERIGNAQTERLQQAAAESPVDIKGILTDKFFEAVSAGETKYASNPAFKNLRTQYEEMKAKHKKQKRTLYIVMAAVVVVLIVLAIIFTN